MSQSYTTLVRGFVRMLLKMKPHVNSSIYLTLLSGVWFVNSRRGTSTPELRITPASRQLTPSTRYRAVSALWSSPRAWEPSLPRCWLCSRQATTWYVNLLCPCNVSKARFVASC